ncbi:MAG: glycosyltransferase family 4 protein [Bacteroides sp.]|nr:glycosyltransferase family 4 protein [Bacteroides sp.]
MEATEKQYPRLLIVGTVPYNRQSTSRAFDAYFHYWPHDKIAQVFSNAATPLKGHCGTLFQITDAMMLNRWRHRDAKVGRIFHRENLVEEMDSREEHNLSSAKKSSKLYSFGARHTPLTHLLRKALWRKKYWNTPEFNRWLDEFKPDCVFLSFSNDFFILEIALYIARKFNIPICSSTGDDYYFDNKFSLNPLYYLYHERYKSLNRRVFKHKGSAIYIGDKIRDKYNHAFGLDGETVYLISEIQRRPFKPINPDCFSVRYFGNIRMGRNNSICRIAEVFAEINPEVVIEVYSAENNSCYTDVFKSHSNINFCGVLPYSEVMKRTVESDFLIVAEGTTKADINLSRYALSTKVADSLASGANIIGYGSPECGAIEYLENIGCATVAHDTDTLVSLLTTLIASPEKQLSNYQRAADILRTNHTLESSNERVRRIVSRIVNNNI